MFDFFDNVKICDNEICNQKNAIVEKIVDDRIEKIDTNDFVNVNNDKKFFVEIVYFDIVKRLIVHRSTIDKCFDVVKKIDEIFVNKSILIYFKFVRINNEFINDISKFDIVFVDELTIFDFENFEFVIYSIKNVEFF